MTNWMKFCRIRVFRMPQVLGTNNIRCITCRPWPHSHMMKEGTKFTTFLPPPSASKFHKQPLHLLYTLVACIVPPSHLPSSPDNPLLSPAYVQQEIFGVSIHFSGSNMANPFICKPPPLHICSF